MKKGFTLIELLAVIVIICILFTLALPSITNLINNEKDDISSAMQDVILQAGQLYVQDNSGIYKKTEGNVYCIALNNLIEDEYLSEPLNDPITNNSIDTNKYIKVSVENKNYLYSITDECNVVENKIMYTDDSLNGTDPVLKDGLVAVVIESDGTVKKADTETSWYDYSNKQWANAVTLKNNITYTDGEVISEDNIDGYFVWIPKFSYKLFNLGNYSSDTSITPTDSVSQEIEIQFGNINTNDLNNGECTTPNTSGGTGNCQIGDYMTHPAFISLGVTGFWAAKFETSGSTTDINILPNKTSLSNINVKTMFELAYNYNRTLDSHMMKNTEWGAVAYLTNSKYGRCTNGTCEEVRINNSKTYTTGCAATTEALTYVSKSQTDHSEGSYDGCENEYNTSIGVLASTTGNITGIYDTSGGTSEYMASYVSGSYTGSGFDSTSIATYNSKYFDVYSSSSTIYGYNYRILGDATGELGPFYNYSESNGVSYTHSTWYSSEALFAEANAPWIIRGGSYANGKIAGIFYTGRNSVTSTNLTFRLVLS
jgi:prepilin-type N-terminal cleavage/methylation domain-containing protein